MAILYKKFADLYFYSYNNTCIYFFIISTPTHIFPWKFERVVIKKKILYLETVVEIYMGTYISTHILINKNVFIYNFYEDLYFYVDLYIYTHY
jgi:hypothetical protein